MGSVNPFSASVLGLALFAAGCSAASLSGPDRSGPPTSQQVDAYIEASGIKAELTEFNQVARVNLREYANREIAIGGIPKGKEAEFRKLQDRYLAVQEKYASEIKWEDALPSLRQAITATYTAADLDSIVAFYKSDAGKKLIQNRKSQNILMNDATKRIYDNISPSTLKATETFRSEIEKMNHS